MKERHEDALAAYTAVWKILAHKTDVFNQTDRQAYRPPDREADRRPNRQTKAIFNTKA